MSEENTTQTEEKKVDPQEKRSRDTGAKDLNHLELSVEGNRTEFRTAKYLANSNKHGEKPLLPGHSTDEGDFGMYVNSTKLGGRDPEKAFEEHKGALVTDLSQQLGCSEEDIELKVLLHYSMDTLGRTPYSNLIIGRHKEDTIAVIDDQFKGNLERGRIVNVKSIKWNYGKINESAPCMIIPNEKKEQQIFCGVSAVYYAELKSD